MNKQQEEAGEKFEIFYLKLLSMLIIKQRNVKLVQIVENSKVISIELVNFIDTNYEKVPERVRFMPKNITALKFLLHFIFEKVQSEEIPTIVDAVFAKKIIQEANLVANEVAIHLNKQQNEVKNGKTKSGKQV